MLGRLKYWVSEVLDDKGILLFLIIICVVSCLGILTRAVILYPEYD